MNEELKDLILTWFSHVEQLATDRKTANGFVMDYQETLDEIRALSSEAQQYILYN